eukprot:scaffold3719_cov247-Pinguiococcus_pyrenoidosus.AAC.5
MSFKFAILRAVELLEAFDVRKQPLDAFLDDHIRAKDDEMFLRQAIYTSLRHSAALKSALELFYFQMAAKASRNDMSVHRILLGVLLFRLEELSRGALKDLLQSLAATVAAPLLEFLLDAQTMNTVLKAELVALYDLEFVEKRLLEPIQSRTAELEAMFRSLELQVVTAEAAKKEREATAGIPKVAKK